MSKKMILKILILLSLLVIISFVLKGFLVHENFPPDRPVKPKGSSNIDVGWSADYSTYTTDPDGDDVRFHIDWGDTKSDTTDFVASGTDFDVPHTWGVTGTYIITASAEDTFGNIGPEATFTVTIPRNKAIYR